MISEAVSVDSLSRKQAKSHPEHGPTLLVSSPVGILCSSASILEEYEFKDYSIFVQNLTDVDASSFFEWRL